MDEFVEWMMIQEVSNMPLANAPQMQHMGKGWMALESLTDCVCLCVCCTVSWYPRRKDADVLWLHYEDMKADLTQCIRLVAQFLNVGADDPKLLKLVEEQAKHFSVDVSTCCSIDSS